MKSKFGAGRDFAVLDPTPRSACTSSTASSAPARRPRSRRGEGTCLYSVRGQLLGIPKKMAITDASGAEVATLRAKEFSVVKDKMDLEMVNGEPWHSRATHREELHGDERRP